MSLSARLISDSREYLEEWKYSEKEIEFLRDTIKDLIEPCYEDQDVKDFIIGNLSETAPREYDDDGIEFHILTNDCYIVIQYPGEESYDVSFWELNEIVGVLFEKTDQRLTLKAFLDSPSTPSQLTTYNKKQYHDYKKFGKKLQRLINGR
jgi:hypothetical protein